MPYLPYEEPGITVLLSLSSFLLLLNGVRYVLDRLLYCGIIGEILIGVIWGLPVGGTAWLSQGTQETIQAFGYVGLISLVFEGGLSTDLALLRESAYVSISIATVGLSLPIALSFILLALPFSSSAGTLYPSPLAAFSAGASLCSTSLGTTFAILSSANLQKSRVGVILVGAAMMDDIVGLVMVNIVTTLGSGETGGWAIARPIVSSFGLLLVVLGLVAFVLRPILTWLGAGDGPRASSAQTKFTRTLRKATTNVTRLVPNLNLLLSILILIILVTIASFINASVLFAAFIAGGAANYFCSITTTEGSVTSTSEGTPLMLYEQCYKQLMDFVLIPFFFVSLHFVEYLLVFCISLLMLSCL
jgi:Kef-type K+ transport system membrane component KefB